MTIQEIKKTAKAKGFISRNPKKFNIIRAILQPEVNNDFFATLREKSVGKIVSGERTVLPIFRKDIHRGGSDLAYYPGNNRYIRRGLSKVFKKLDEGGEEFEC
jgi:hypothetical protein